VRQSNSSDLQNIGLKKATKMGKSIRNLGKTILSVLSATCLRNSPAISTFYQHRQHRQLKRNKRYKKIQLLAPPAELSALSVQKRLQYQWVRRKIELLAPADLSAACFLKFPRYFNLLGETIQHIIHRHTLYNTVWLGFACFHARKSEIRRFEGSKV
jgi:hypothetical protein